MSPHSRSGRSGSSGGDARIRRVNDAVREVLADTIGDLKDPGLGFVTLTDVRTSNDLRHAEVFYTVLPDTDEVRGATGQALRRATPLLRRELGANLRVRYVPELEFTLDPLPAQGRRVDELLREVGTTDADED